MIEFTKMHGLGNDFMVIDAINQAVELSPDHVRALADRHFGVGFDQLLLVEPASGPDSDFRYRIFNADGGEVGQCGNGARCFMQFVHERGLTDRDRVRVETRNGLLELQREKGGLVTVNMGVPRLAPQDIPFQATDEALSYPLEVGNRLLVIGAVSMGNPHAVVRVEDTGTAAVAELGPLIESHPSFPERTNAGFMQVLDRNHIRLRVYERGAGETLACGSGACAAVVIGRRWELLDESVHVAVNGGDLVVSWSGPGMPVMMTGPATTVYQGCIEL